MYHPDHHLLIPKSKSFHRIQCLPPVPLGESVQQSSSGQLYRSVLSRPWSLELGLDLEFTTKKRADKWSRSSID